MWCLAQSDSDWAQNGWANPLVELRSKMSLLHVLACMPLWAESDNPFWTAHQEKIRRKQDSRIAFVHLQNLMAERVQVSSGGGKVVLYKHQCIAPLRELVNVVITHLASTPEVAKVAAAQLQRLAHERVGKRHRFSSIGSLRQQIDDAVDSLKGPDVLTERASRERPTPTYSSILATQIASHVKAFEASLESSLICSGDGAATCPGWWHDEEQKWKRNATSALASRLALHALKYSEFLPDSEPCTLKAHLDTVRRTRGSLKSILEEYWQTSEFSCGLSLKRTRTSVGGNDGGKWLCGVRSTDFAQPCRVLSIGCNFEDDFERSVQRLASCRSWIFDPTLGREDSPRVRRFADSLALYGSRLNASTGLGVGSILDRNTTRHALRPLADLLSGTGRFFRVEGAGSHRYHLAVAKIDAEGGEFIGGLLGPKGLWSLCADGTLTVDQVTTEIHLRKAGSLAAVNAIFEGAARCGLVLLHYESNRLGCHYGGCAEVSWASLRHLRRVLDPVRSAIS